jgi:hypothetical protein
MSRPTQPEIGGPLAPTISQFVDVLTNRPIGTFADVRDRLMEAVPKSQADIDDLTAMWRGHRFDSTIMQRLIQSSTDIGLALSSGALFNFGTLANEVIIDTSSRAFPLYNKGHLPAPFPVWIGAHEFPMQIYKDEAPRTIWCAYVVRHNDDGSFIVTELWMRGRGRDCLYAIAGNLLVRSNGSRWSGEGASGLPNDLLPGYGGSQDAVLAMLMLLNTRGLPVTRNSPAPRLNAARAKSSKPPLPAHWSVDVTTYATALRETNRRDRGAPAGTHASPTPHLRRAHMRNLRTGDAVPVRECVVGLRGTDADEQANPFARSHYVVGR